MDAGWGAAEQSALTTAQLAHIMQHGDYAVDDPLSPIIKHWTPERIKPQ
jgi:hypothetical protein